MKTALVKLFLIRKTYTYFYTISFTYYMFLNLKRSISFTISIKI